MDMLSPTLARWLADLVLVVHVAIVVFVVLGQLAILIGGCSGWAWIRHFGFRVTHLALIAIVVLQAWLGRACPLTIWEQALRRHAGQKPSGDSFVEHWLSRLIFFDAPWWVFVAAYSAFAAVVALSWAWLPPTRHPARR